MRRVVALAPILLVALANVAVRAEPHAGPLFNIFLHDNDEAFAAFPTDDVLARMWRSGKRAYVANSRPNDGTVAQAAAPQDATAGVTVVPSAPFAHLYRNRPDCTGWFTDETVCKMVQQQLAASTNVGPFKGIGEFHLYDCANVDGAVAIKLMLLAQDKHLAAFAYADDDAIDRLLRHAPRAQLI